MDMFVSARPSRVRISFRVSWVRIAGVERNLVLAYCVEVDTLWDLSVDPRNICRHPEQLLRIMGYISGHQCIMYIICESSTSLAFHEIFSLGFKKNFISILGLTQSLSSTCLS